VQTFLHELLRDTPDGREADRILRSCVHCGFCNATCPTYQLLGDERDGPRGRIYLIKEMLEQNTATRETREHLDRCLLCRSCETTCPSGVEYHRLLEIGRTHVEALVGRSLPDRLKRRALVATVPEPARLEPLLKLGRLARPLLPGALKAKLPAATAAPDWPAAVHERRVILLEGCVQSLTHPRINSAAARVLDRLGVSALPGAGCCGALAQHLPAPERARETVRRNVDAWWPFIEDGAEAVLLTATGCAPTVMDYGRLLADDSAYAERAERLASMAMDISVFLAGEDPEPMRPAVAPPAPIAFHAPCSLQHALKRPGAVERLLQELGFELTPVADAHLCCGSAGAYSVLQADIADQLRSRKLNALEAGQPSLIATANIGCLQHLQAGTGLEVKHWIELLA
jgi:glycolate oxidase iron-sulfur subunit